MTKTPKNRTRDGIQPFVASMREDDSYKESGIGWHIESQGVGTDLGVPDELLAIPGVLGKLARHLREYDWRRDVVRALGLALAALSSVSAGYELVHVDERLHADLYFVLVCGSATAKTTLARHMIDLVEEALDLIERPDECPLNAPDALGSMEGLWDQLAKTAIGTTGGMVAKTFILDEFGQELLAMTGANAGYRAHVLPLLRRLTNAGRRVVPAPSFSQRSKNMQARGPLHYPVVGLLGLTTKRPLAQALNSRFLENGTAGRFLVLLSHDLGKAERTKVEVESGMLKDLAMIWRETLRVANDQARRKATAHRRRPRHPSGAVCTRTPRGAR
jgi:hypothetical protein